MDDSFSPSVRILIFIGLMAVLFWLAGPALVAIILIALFWHEFAHMAVFKHYGVGTKIISFGFGGRFASFNAAGIEWRLSTFPLGGYVMPETKAEGLSFMQRFWVSAAGPGSNLLLYSLIFLIILAANGWQLSSLLVKGFWTELAYFNFILFIWNMAPIWILDGKKMLACLWLHYKLPEESFNAVQWIIAGTIFFFILCIMPGMRPGPLP